MAYTTVAYIKKVVVLYINYDFSSFFIEENHFHFHLEEPNL